MQKKLKKNLLTIISSGRPEKLLKANSPAVKTFGGIYLNAAEKLNRSVVRCWEL